MSGMGYGSSSPSHFAAREDVSPIHRDATRVSPSAWHVKLNKSDAFDELGESEAEHWSQARPFDGQSGGPSWRHGPSLRLNSFFRKQDSTPPTTSLRATEGPLVSTTEGGAPTSSTSAAFSTPSGRSVPLPTSSPPASLPASPTTSDVSVRSDSPLGSTSSQEIQSTPSTIQPASNPSTPFTSTPTSTAALTSTIGINSSRQSQSSPRTSLQTEPSVTVSLTSQQILGSSTASGSAGSSVSVSLSLLSSEAPSPTKTPITTSLETSNASTRPSTVLSPTSIDTWTINIPTSKVSTTSIGISAATTLTTAASMTESSSTTYSTTTIIDTSQTTTIAATLSDSPTSTAASPPVATSSTLDESTTSFTSSTPTLSPPASTGVINSTTSFDVSSTIGSIPQSTTMLSSDDSSSTLQLTPASGSSTPPPQITSPVPILTSPSPTITLNIPLSRSTIFTSTYTKYWTTAYPGGPTVTYSTIIETGVLSTDKSRPNGFSHNTGAIIGIALAGTFTVIILVLIIFFTCKKYKQRDVVSGSRENFLSRDVGAGVSVWRPPLDDEEFDPGYADRGLEPGDDGMMTQFVAGAVSYPLYPNETGDTDRGEIADGRHGTFGGDASAESAMMYPIQRQSEPEYWPNVAQVGLALPYEHPQNPSGGNSSDPFGYDHAPRDVGASTSGTGHGHQNYDAIASSIFFGSSSHGHLINAAGADAPQTSSSGHGMDDSGRRSKNASPVEERYKFPPSSYVPPGRIRTGSDSSGSGGGNSSDSLSVKGLFGKLKSISKDMMKEKNKNNLQHKGSRSPGLSRSSGESTASRPSMSFSLGHSSGPGHTSLTSHHGHGYPYYGMPSSLLNPPKSMPLAMPIGDIPPVPTIRHTESGLMVNPYFIPDEYSHSLPFAQDPGRGLGPSSDSPYADAWPPPTIFRSSPSPVPTESSSYVEGLLNPYILPGTSGSLGVSSAGVPKTRGNGGLSDKGGGLSLGAFRDDGESVMSLRDNVDYSRPISGAVMHRSTTTFGTDVDSANIGIEEAVGPSRGVGAEIERCRRPARIDED